MTTNHDDNDNDHNNDGSGNGTIPMTTACMDETRNSVSNNAIHGQRDGHWRLEKLSIAGGPVTCVCFLSDDCLLVARGPYLDTLSSSHCTTRRKTLLVFPNGGSVHGVHAHGNVLIVYGGRQLAFCCKPNDDDDNDNDNDNGISVLDSSISVSDWIQDVQTRNDSGHGEKRLRMALALANNTCELWSISTELDSKNDDNSNNMSIKAVRLLKTVAETRCITYAMSFPGWEESAGFSVNPALTNTSTTVAAPSHQGLMVASGTVFNEVLLWEAISYTDYRDDTNHDQSACQTNDSTKQSHDDDDNTTTTTTTNNNNNNKDTRRNVPSNISTTIRPILHRLCGHEGVILGVRMGVDGNTVVSTSDDRSVRLWRKQQQHQHQRQQQHQQQNTQDKTSTTVPIHTDIWTSQWIGWGHSARVWDIVLLPSQDVVMSSSEDGSIKVWDWKTGKEVGEGRCTPSQSLWRLAACGGQVVAGRNDGRIQAWGMDDIFQIDGITSIVPVPDDREKKLPTNSPEVIIPPNAKDASRGVPRTDKTGTNDTNEPNGAMDENTTEKKPKKKKGKKAKVPKVVGQTVLGMAFCDDPTGCGAIVIATRSGSVLSFPLSSSTAVKPSASSLSPPVSTTLEQRHDTLADTSKDVGVVKVIQKQTTNDGWVQLEPWWDTALGQQVQPSHGTCMSILDGRLAIGTTKGFVVVLSIRRLPDSGNERGRLLGDANDYKSVQGIHWIEPTLIVSLHIRGILVVWTTKKDHLEIHRVLDTATAAIPSCITAVARFCSVGLDKDDSDSGSDGNSSSLFVVGDARGNVLSFNLKKEGNGVSESLTPTSSRMRAHRKEHVNCIETLSDGRILSGGNDGYVRQYSIEADGTLISLLYYPVFGLSGIARIWEDFPMVTPDGKQNGEATIVVGGYTGNIFLLKDLQTGTDVLRFNTSGRQRLLDCFYDCSTNTTNTTSLGTSLGLPGLTRRSKWKTVVSVCAQQKDGTNHLLIGSHANRQPTQQLNITGSHCCGAAMHRAPIFDCCLFRSQGKQIGPDNTDKTIYALTGSEDCSARLSCFRESRVMWTHELPPQESCVRAVCANRFFGSSRTLLCVGGAKLAVQFFLMNDGDPETCPVISELGKGLLPSKEAIDHRVNAVIASTLTTTDDKHSGVAADGVHVVFVGDSSGAVSYFLVNENEMETSSRTRPASLRGHHFTTLDRPVLTLDAVTIDDWKLFLVGTTAGDIRGYLLGPDRFSDVPVFTVQAHQVGTNAISACLLDDTNNGDGRTVLVASGGDDQSLNALTVHIQPTKAHNENEQCVHIQHNCNVREASASAIKSVHAFSNGIVLSVGYNQRLGMWQLTNDGQLSFITSSAIDVADVNCLGSLRLDKHVDDSDSNASTANGSFEAMAIIGGEGAEFVKIAR